MSDADEFDKEAERRKLREKFAEDDEKREHTQRMSELLLKGATMTDQHCDRCGDPIFRHDGQEFCPSCNRPGEGGQAAGKAGGAGTSEAAEATEAADAGGPAGGPTDQPAETAVNPQAGGRPGAASQQPETPRADDRTTPPRQPPQPVQSEQSGQSPPQTGAEAGAAESGHQAPVDTGSPVAGVADARASLVRTLTKFSRAAEQTDDPRRAREHLRAAREAAETLAALE
ncbi:hypothetical protein JCM17823_19130 [Halorubrum gandharaense]